MSEKQEGKSTLASRALGANRTTAKNDEAVDPTASSTTVNEQAEEAASDASVIVENTQADVVKDFFNRVKQGINSADNKTGSKFENEKVSGLEVLSLKNGPSFTSQKIEEKINTFKYDSNLSAYENEKNMLKELKELRIMKAAFGNESNFGLIDIESLRSKKETDDEGNKPCK